MGISGKVVLFVQIWKKYKTDVKGKATAKKPDIFLSDHYIGAPHELLMTRKKGFAFWHRACNIKQASPTGLYICIVL